MPLELSVLGCSLSRLLAGSCCCTGHIDAHGGCHAGSRPAPHGSSERTSRLAILGQQQCRTPNSRRMLVLHGMHKQWLAHRLACSSSLGLSGRGCQVEESDRARGQLRPRDVIADDVV
jgi:hypothetical protein